MALWFLREIPVTDSVMTRGTSPQMFFLSFFLPSVLALD